MQFHTSLNIAARGFVLGDAMSVRDDRGSIRQQVPRCCIGLGGMLLPAAWEGGIGEGDWHALLKPSILL